MADNNRNENAEPLREDEVKEVVNTWIDILKIPTISGAYIREDNNFLNVISKWSVDDAAKKERISFARTFSVLKSSLDSDNPIVSTPGPVTVDEKLCVPSKSGQRRAVLVEKSGNGDSGSKTEFLQIWNDSSLVKTYNLTELDLHKQVYTSGGWGITMTWSANETKLAYLAEKKVSKTKSFYSSAARTPVKKDDGKKDETELGEEYVYKQTWGEQLTGQYNSVIVVLDVATDEFKVLSLPEDNFPTDLQWIGDSYICGTTYPVPIWRLGLIYCSNRESRIFTVQADGENFQMLTEERKSARSPRVRPDGKYVVWQERILDGAHDRARSIYGVALQNGVPSGQPQLIRDASPEDGLPAYQDFSRNCWSNDGSILYVTTPNEGKNICLAITLGSSNQVKKIEGLDSLLSVTSEYLLVSSSSTLSSPVLKLLKISQDYKPLKITDSTSPIDPEKTVMELVYGDASPPSIYHGPAIESVPPNSTPLVVWPHGGPHSCFIDSFSHEASFFLKLGFAIIRLNYVGSIGGVRDTADDLLGKIGDRDVKDCQGMVQKVLNSMPCLNPDKVVVFGGSHGGFLGCHLSSAYPDVYKAAALRNPVTDLTTLVGTSDITDWAYAESGVTLPEYPVGTIIPTPRDLIDAEKFITASPIHHVNKVKGATLLLLGSDDLRVPPQQGINYYRALRAYNKIAEIRMYPDSHPLSKAPVRLDTIIHSALWFKRYLR